MSQPPEDREQRIEARPGSEIPKWNPGSNDDEEQDERDPRYDGLEDWRRGPSSGAFSPADLGDGYHDADLRDTYDEGISPEPLSPPEDTPDHEQRAPWNGRTVFAPPLGRVNQNGPVYANSQDYWSESPVGQAGAAGYGPDAQAVPGLSSSGVMKIGLWGSPASGKTTFLAVLRHATSARGGDRGSGNGIGTWNVYPMTTTSTNLMAAFTHQLSQGYFPNPTDPGEQVPLQWMFVGDIAHSRFVRKRERLLRRNGIESRFVLDLIDMSGKAFGYDPSTESVPPSIAAQALDRLTEADGIIYLFDPIGERDNRNSSSYVNRAITELKYRAVNNRRAARRLDQQVAICVTKFDDPAVFQEARRHGFVNHDEYGLPHVPDKHAEDFFDLLCTDRYWRTRFEQSSQSADFIRRELRQVFGRENIKYYVTSSIGFYRPPGWRPDGSTFDPEDFSNVVQVAGNTPRIRGTINPINVLEPLVDVHQRIAGRA